MCSRDVGQRVLFMEFWEKMKKKSRGKSFSTGLGGATRKSEQVFASAAKWVGGWVAEERVKCRKNKTVPKTKREKEWSKKKEKKGGETVDCV